MSNTDNTVYLKLPGSVPDVLRIAATNLDDDPDNKSYQLFWRNASFYPSDFKYVITDPLKKLNHFQKSNCICDKDLLLKNMRRMCGAFGKIFAFTPESYTLPNDYMNFLKSYTKNKKEGAIWIVKPSDLAQGKKIYVLSDINNLYYDRLSVVQKYIEPPLTIGGYKNDLRIYCLVTSISPLRIYLYDNGLVRFSTQKYSGDITNVYSHLTNSSLNKFSPTYETDKEVIGSKCKWELKRLRDYFEDNNCTLYPYVMEDIGLLICLTCLILIYNNNETHSNFELFGFDFMLDSNLKAWLIEVNCAPALTMDSDIDERVKIPLITDTLKLSGVEESLKDYNKKVERDIEESLSNPHYRYSSSKVNNLYQATPNDYIKCNDVFDLQDHLNGTEMMYHPCELGGYKMIFPFNQESLSNSIQLANNSCKDNVSNEFMRKVIDDIRQKQFNVRKVIRSLKSSNTLEKPKMLYQMNPSLKPKPETSSSSTDSTTTGIDSTNSSNIRHTVSYRINISSNEEKLSEYAKKYEKKPSTCPNSSSSTKAKKDSKSSSTATYSTPSSSTSTSSTASSSTSTTATTTANNSNNRYVSNSSRNSVNNNSNNNNNRISTRKSEEMKSNSTKNNNTEIERLKEREKKFIPPAPTPIEKEVKEIKWKPPKLPVKSDKERFKGVDKETIAIYTNAFKNIKKSNIKPPTKRIVSKKMLPE